MEIMLSYNVTQLVRRGLQLVRVATGWKIMHQIVTLSHLEKVCQMFWTPDQAIQFTMKVDVSQCNLRLLAKETVV